MRVARLLVARGAPWLLVAVLAPPTAVAQPADALATFGDTVEVRVVNIDVVVLDRDGQPVTGLVRGDFQLTVDGRPTELSNFAAYEESLHAAAGEASLEPGSTPAAPAGAESEATAPPATWIVFIDQSNLDLGPRNQVAGELRDFLVTNLRGGDRVMVAAFDGKSLKILSPVSADRQTALDALTGLARSVGYPSLLRRRTAQIQRDIASLSRGSMSGGFEAQNLRAEIASLGEEFALQMRGSLDAIRDLLALVAGVGGRVAMIVGGGGYPSSPTDDLYRQLDARLGRKGDPGPDFSRDRDSLTLRNRIDYSRLLKTVNASRVTIYSVFAGADRTAGVSAEIGGAPSLSGPALSTTSPESGSTLSAFAAETGGRAFVGAPDLAERLTTARRDFSTYYSLGYQPQRTDPGAFHSFALSVRGEGLQLVYRRGIQERAADDIAGDAATAALLTAAPPANPLGAALQVGEATRQKVGHALSVPVIVRLPLRGLTLLPEAAAHRARLAFHFTLRDPDGGFRRLEPRPLEFRVPDPELAGALGKSVAFKVELVLEPGSYDLGVAVVDELGGATSAVTTGFQVAKAPGASRSSAGGSAGGGGRKPRLG